MTGMRTPIGLMLSGCWLVALAWLSWNSSYGSVGLLWLPVVGALCYFILRHGTTMPEASGGHVLWSRLWWLNALSVLFFFNCITPYLGLKTAQSMNMFANLRLEAGKSNHLVLQDPPGPFGYLADVVSIRASKGSATLLIAQREGLYLTYYALLDHLDRNPSVSVDFERQGSVLFRQNAATLAGEIERTLHPRWFRNWFHFNPVDLREPKLCALNR